MDDHGATPTAAARRDGRTDTRIVTEAAGWVVDYLDRIGALPVLSGITPGDVVRALPDTLPAQPAAWDEVAADLEQTLVPAMTHWNHPRFFGYFANSSPPAAIAGELIAAATNQNAMLWRTSPAASELEEVTTRWVAELLGLPPWFGVIHDTASTSTFCALAAARYRSDPSVTEHGLAGATPRTVYTSDQAHSSVDKAVAALGLGLGHLRRVATDRAARLDPVALEAAVVADIEGGRRPMAVVATVGTTAATAVDPLPTIARVCRAHDLWLHVDAAYGGSAAVSPSMRWILEGAEAADSLVVNPHKWLFVPLDCSVLYLREPDLTRAAFSLVPEYLEAPEEAVNLMDYGLALGRRWRSLKLWLVLRTMGRAGVVAAIEEHLRLARLLAGWVEATPDFELVTPPDFAVVNFRWLAPASSAVDADTANRALADRVNRSGEAFLTTAMVGGRTALHASVGNLGTTEEDVARLWEAVRLAAGETRTDR